MIRRTEPDRKALPMHTTLRALAAPTLHPPPFYRRLPTQLMLAALIPIALASVLISLPLIEGRRTQLLSQELLRAQQSVQTTELLAAERIRSATLLLQLLAERPEVTAPTSTGALAETRAYRGAGALPPWASGQRS
jgi:hypothetical protein